MSKKKQKKKTKLLVQQSKKPVAVYQAPSREITPADLQMISKVANEASKTPFFAKLGGFSGIFSIMLYAKEIGLPPMQAIFGGMNSIQGKIEISHHAMNSLIRGKGHKLSIVELSDTLCTVKGERKDSGETMVVSFSIDEAKKAGLCRGGSGWEKYTKDMLYARAMSRLGKRLFGDVIGCGTYAVGEIQELPEEHLAAEEVEVVQESSSYTTDTAAQEMSKALEIDNTPNLAEYIEFCSSKTMRPLEALVPLWIEKKELFLENFEKRKRSMQENGRN